MWTLVSFSHIDCLYLRVFISYQRQAPKHLSALYLTRGDVVVAALHVFRFIRQSTTQLSPSSSRGIAVAAESKNLIPASLYLFYR